jgi:hypothetical protein
VHVGPYRPAVSGVVVVIGAPTPSTILNTKSGRFVPRFPTERVLSEPISSGDSQSNGVAHDQIRLSGRQLRAREPPVSVSTWHPQPVENQSQTGELGDLEEAIEDRSGKFQDINEEQAQRGLNEQH